MSGLASPNIKTHASTPNLSNIASANTEIDPTQPISTYPDLSTFNILPELYLLISRLSELKNPPQPVSNSTITTATVPKAPAPTANGAVLTSQSTINGTTQETSTSGTAADNLTHTVSRESQHSATGSLRQVSSAEQYIIEARDLPAHVYHLKRRIEEAKELVKGLPDVDRNTTEQEREMEELRMSISGLKGRLIELGNIASRGKDVMMGGTEDGAG